MGYLLATLLLATGVLALVASATSRPDRNYWPMLRTIFAALAFVYIGSGVSRLLATWHGVRPANPATPLALVFSAAILAALAYGVWFMRRRNHTARFIRMDLDGSLTFLPVEDLERAASLTASWVHHGTAPRAVVVELQQASAEWHRKERWHRSIAGQRGTIDD